MAVMSHSTREEMKRGFCSNWELQEQSFQSEVCCGYCNLHHAASLDDLYHSVILNAAANVQGHFQLLGLS